MPPDVPPDFAPILRKGLAELARKLGYFGEERFVIFYYEVGADGVIWKDRHTYGFGSGAWQTFMQEVAGLAAFHGVNLGNCGSSAHHVLVIDRVHRAAYFAQRERGERFLGESGPG